MDDRNTAAEARLHSLLPGYAGELFWLRETDSTNRQLRILAETGAEAGTVLLADGQTAGHGRLGRSFASPDGKGLYLSLLLRPEVSPTELGSLTPWAAVAVRRAVREVCGLNADIKWVNDLLCRGRKLCGILTEGAFREGKVQYAVLGVGVNLSALPEDFPPELRETATSIRQETGLSPEREALAAAVIRELAELPRLWKTGGEAYFTEYCSACVTLGQPVRLSDGTEGVAETLGRDFALLLRLPDGGLQRVQSGEAVFRR